MTQNMSQSMGQSIPTGLNSSFSSSQIPRYESVLGAVLGRVFSTQREAMAEAAHSIAQAVAAGGRFHIMDTGHMVARELYERAGGLALLNVINNVEELDKPFLTRRGDVIVVVSVSGKSEQVVRIALELRDRGLRVLALTALAHSKAAEPEHPSGKRLFEVADLVIDTCGEPGDAMLAVEGLAEKICPSSGIAGAAIMWAIIAQVADNLLVLGIRPHVFKSINLPGGAEYLAELRKEFSAEAI